MFIKLILLLIFFLCSLCFFPIILFFRNSVCAVFCLKGNPFNFEGLFIGPLSPFWVKLKNLIKKLNILNNTSLPKKEDSTVLSYTESVVPGESLFSSFDISAATNNLYINFFILLVIWCGILFMYFRFLAYENKSRIVFVYTKRILLFFLYVLTLDIVGTLAFIIYLKFQIDVFVILGVVVTFIFFVVVANL